MRPKTRSLGFLLIFAGACSQIIGLSDYEKTGDDDNAAGAGTGGVRDTGGAANTGGKGGRAGTGGGSAARSGSGAEAGEVERGGAGGVPNPTGGRNTGGRNTSGGEANAGGIGGAPRGGEGGTSEGGAPTIEGGVGGAGGDAGGAGGAGGGATSTGGSPTCIVNQELLANRNFDATDIAPWFQASSEGRTEILPAGEMPPGLTPFSTPNSAVLGGTGLHIDIDDDPDTMTDGGDATVGQYVTVPVGAKQLTLTCYYRLVTEEVEADDYDLMVAWLYDYDNQVSALKFNTWSNQDVVNSWQKLTFSADATAVAGGDYSMEFYALVDSTKNTWFGVDNCSLKVTQCN
jgi:hypothetical protein